ncbi:beta-phosphoglucomutase [Aerococcaceae bacterium zg-BR9]|uniref:beta-phosphoglucomutase n=1 Tax=Aerococcaceae bacterium zg-1292 TaxID=2774330 RepID=UPI004063173B|nr:beta-phosphoglucomutase [Aerococcaceae bacterium zg-BR9]
MKKLKGIIFDLDGVITDSAEYHYVAWKNLANNLGIDIDRKFNEKLKGISREDSLERILEYGKVLNDYSDDEKSRLAEQKNEEYLKLIKQMTADDLLPGIHNLLTDAKAKGIKLALASASKNGPFILERLGIEKLFDTIVDPSILSAGKPDPEIFIRAVQQLDLSPEECIGIEDAEAGVKAINAANIFSIGVGSSDVLHEANYCLTNTSKLKLDNILEQFESNMF